ncbi:MULTISPECIES: DUF2867 domain-containing protein [Frankia]|uniref:DUF2867 domain-containing protein n=1 Tax=Frankia alni (strain DSM 45986 / CECT 9034 / ACN14a) TaxID=326424 RepID=Q0RES5_FRAAA|nr:MULTISPECIES: DUF2867 domain-containing protein [Frankia]CAJ64031.1 Hypothetical protein FRAAL5398 [Frankia alni ACN14a]
MSASADRFDRIDYRDTYSVALPEPMDAPAFCARILEAAPRWLEMLLSARDVVAGRLGFQTQERNYGRSVHLSVGGKFGPLVVRSIEADRVVCADSDPHLAFRAIFTTREGIAPRGSFTTEVQLNDTLGRAYFAVVKPFHRLIIPSLVSAPFPGKAVAE